MTAGRGREASGCVGLVVDSQQWTIPGEAIAGYSVPQNAPCIPGEVVALGDLTQDSVDFYWKDGGDGRQVIYEASSAGQDLTCAATFDVKRPQSTLTTVTKDVQVNGSGETGNWYLGMRFGAPETYGIEFDGTIAMPARFSGQTCFCQVYDMNRRLQLDQLLSPWQECVGDGLDHTFPYDGPWSTVVELNPKTGDIPALQLIPGATVGTVEDFANTWLMFKPDGGDSIWVPLRKVQWWWQGQAHKQVDGTWALDWGDNSDNPASEDTTEYPTWNYNIEDNEWRLVQ